MSQQVDNLRTRRTRKLLRVALIELIEERGFDRLTVGEITQRAMVSRAAFYRNYRDKFQLVEQIFDEAIHDLVGAMEDGDEREVEERWISFFEHISKYHRLYGALLGRTGSPWFANRMRSIMADMVKQHLPKDPAADGSNPSEATDLVPTLVSAMFVQAITWWLESNRPSTPAQIADQSAKLAMAILTEANSWKSGQAA